MAPSSITTLVVFLRHLQRLVLVDNLGGALKWHAVSQMWGARGVGTRALGVVETLFSRIWEADNHTFKITSKVGFQYLKLPRKKEQRGGYHSH
jgi:hypothetical protein